MEKEVRIFGHPWHISHQYELAKIPGVKFSWLAQHKRTYSQFPRGDMLGKFGINWVPYYESGKYDLALLHLDQQCLDEHLWDHGKGSLFKELNKVITDIPKIMIMHGTPYYPENFSCDIFRAKNGKTFVFAPKKTDSELKEWEVNKEEEIETGPQRSDWQSPYTLDQVGMSSILIERFHTVTKDCDYLIFNSKVAAKQWGVTDENRGKCIWHGMDVDEWWDLPKEPRVVTMISPAGLGKYYDRDFLTAVKDELDTRDIRHCHITVDASFKSFDEYRNFLGRSLIYFNPTKESPMPRSRTEAMLSGCCIVTTPHQDAGDFIENGKNGILVPRNPKTVADIIEGLINDYKTAVALGQKAKQTAIEVFDGDRYRKEWREILDKVISNYKK